MSLLAFILSMAMFGRASSSGSNFTTRRDSYQFYDPAKPQIGATASQMGQAASLRDFALLETKKQLNLIVHSEDVNPHKFGPNQYAGKAGIYDLMAQKVIDKARLEKIRMQGKK
mmetsp:Transcript_22988/g.78266  ORF Transcript_22988/g.78266 Transcript_22988/m.78266 type:complete len:114 (+) Transcript_22988:67-408(+)